MNRQETDKRPWSTPTFEELSLATEVRGYADADPRVAAAQARRGYGLGAGEEACRAGARRSQGMRNGREE